MATATEGSGPVLVGLPTLRPPGPPEPLRLELTWADRDWVVHLVDAGLACCSLEVMAAALGSRAARARRSLPVEEAGAAVDVLVISGTCTTALAPMLQELHSGLGRVRVVAFGACSASGGPYWDSYSVVAGVGSLVPVDAVVPGCPPPPEALLEALALLEEGRA
jgi:NADH-quinone oxidoreductase subunit B